MYIGETERTLRVRFRDYLNEAESDSIRPKLLRILPLYRDYLHFACTPLPKRHFSKVPKVFPKVLELETTDEELTN
jgi:hypothetical protein